jgi:hypothetical protein
MFQKMFFYHPNSYCVAKRCLCHRVEILKIIYVGYHDLDQSLSSDVDVDADIIDMLYFP